MSNALRFRTADQALLFNDEIRGQLSDGNWENARPYDHWKPWCKCEIEVGAPVGRTFWAQRTTYALASSNLLAVIGKRMERLVKLGRKYGPGEARFLSDHLFDMDGKFTGGPAYEGQYYDDVRKRLSHFNMGEVNAIANSDSYTRRDLRKDLNEMKEAMETIAYVDPAWRAENIG